MKDLGRVHNIDIDNTTLEIYFYAIYLMRNRGIVRIGSLADITKLICFSSFGELEL